MKLAVTLLVVLQIVPSLSFFGSKTSRTSKPTFGKTTEAVAIYQKKYPSKPIGKRSALVGLGVPRRDFDGTLIKKANGEAGKRFSDRDAADLSATLTELCKVYGEDKAFQMVKDMPIVLAFNKNYFAPSLAAFGKTFGEAEARAMVQRNPGLLALPPTGAFGADSATDQTMQFSYVVAATRPLGPVLLYGLLALLCEPAFESLSGIPLRQTLFSGFGF
jgi:hypothetical protein